MKQVELRVFFDEVSFSVDLREEPLTLGRAPGCSISLIDPLVSWFHATIWLTEGQVWVRDERSTHGVSLDGRPVVGVASVPSGSVLGFGPNVRVSVDARPTELAPAVVLDDLRQGRRVALGLGANPLDQLGMADFGVLFLREDGSAILEFGPERRALVPGEVLELGELCLRLGSVHETRTLGERPDAPYHLAIQLQGVGSPAATFTDPVDGRSLKITSENQVFLLHLLGRRLEQDRAEGLPVDRQGWCHDDALASGIWGKGERSLSTLPVTVHRLRRALLKASFRHEFLEKGRRTLRAVLGEVRWT